MRTTFVAIRPKRGNQSYSARSADPHKLVSTTSRLPSCAPQDQHSILSARISSSDRLPARHCRPSSSTARGRMDDRESSFSGQLLQIGIVIGFSFGQPQRQQDRDVDPSPHRVGQVGSQGMQYQHSSYFMCAFACGSLIPEHIQPGGRGGPGGTGGR